MREMRIQPEYRCRRALSAKRYLKLSWQALFLPILMGAILLFDTGDAVRAAVPPQYTHPANTQQVAADIIYDPQTKTIEVKRPGAVITLSDIYAALRNDSLLERRSNGEWLLKVNLKIFELVRLELHGRSAGGDVDWLKLRSEPSGYAYIECSNGQISIRNTRITSWDTRTGGFDTDFDDGSGRAYISTKNRSTRYTTNRMDVIDSEIGYLGFFEETAYGISWKVISEPGEPETGILGQSLTGTVTGSKFHHNYFGLYVWGVGNMLVSNNEFYENFRYGFDAHTGTRRVTLENNYSHNNGTHGIIFADRCTENIIRHNTSVNNKGHGIMLHELSNNNIVEDNTANGNDDGIPLFESSNNVISHNIVRNNNVTGVRVYGRDNSSSKNVFEDNEISGSKGYGIFMYDAAVENSFINNRIMKNGNAGIYGKGILNNFFTGNIISGNDYGIRFDSADTGVTSTGNEIRNNAIADNRQFGFYSYAPPAANLLDGNQFSGNVLGDTGYSGSFASPASHSTSGFKLVLFTIIVIAGLITAPVIYFRQRAARKSAR